MRCHRAAVLAALLAWSGAEERFVLTLDSGFERTAWKREKGDYGYGAYGNEPWSLQAMEKRVYAIRDFYKRELKGTNMDDPASDPLVTGTLAALVLLVGRKSMHVPKVRATELSLDCARKAMDAVGKEQRARSGGA